MQIPKPSEQDKDFLRAIVPDDDRVQVKPMFGQLGAFVNGNMFAGLFGSAIGVRLDEAGRAELLAVAGAGPFGPAERPMGGYVGLPASWREEPDQAELWILRALTHTAALPPKKAKARKADRVRPSEQTICSTPNLELDRPPADDPRGGADRRSRQGWSRWGRRVQTPSSRSPSCCGPPRTPSG
jgi:TfoX/Sxy family transcriptional regulator of competence genes